MYMIMWQLRAQFWFWFESQFILSQKSFASLPQFPHQKTGIVCQPNRVKMRVNGNNEYEVISTMFSTQQILNQHSVYKVTTSVVKCYPRCFHIHPPQEPRTYQVPEIQGKRQLMVTASISLIPLPLILRTLEPLNYFSIANCLKLRQNAHSMKFIILIISKCTFQ